MNETQREVLKSTVSVAIDDILENASTALLRRCIAPAPATIDTTSPNQNQNQNFRNDIHQLVRQFQHVPEATLKFAVRLREAYLGMTPAIDFQIATLNLTYNENIRGVPFGLERMGDAPAQRDIQQVMRNVIEKRIAKAEGRYESKKKMPVATTTHAATASARTERYLQYSSDANMERQLQMELLAEYYEGSSPVHAEQKRQRKQQVEQLAKNLGENEIICCTSGAGVHKIYKVTF